MHFLSHFLFLFIYVHFFYSLIKLKTCIIQFFHFVANIIFFFYVYKVIGIFSSTSSSTVNLRKQQSMPIPPPPKKKDEIVLVKCQQQQWSSNPSMKKKQQQGNYDHQPDHRDIPFLGVTQNSSNRWQKTNFWQTETVREVVNIFIFIS